MTLGISGNSIQLKLLAAQVTAHAEFHVEVCSDAGLAIPVGTFLHCSNSTAFCSISTAFCSLYLFFFIISYFLSFFFMRKSLIWQAMIAI